MMEKSFRYSKNRNECDKKSQEGNNVNSYVTVALATIALAILVSAGNTILRNIALNASNHPLASISKCKANALEYERLGYYTGDGIDSLVNMYRMNS
jgi:hypothetical protein